MIKKISSEIIFLNKKFQGICKKPYHGHSKGCPNYGKKEGCPPGIDLLDDIFNFQKDLYLIYTTFPIGKFAERMLEMHPEWSEHPRQIYNPRRWQGTARKEHKQELEKFVLENPELRYTKLPEAHGVHVSDVMDSIGVKLNWDWPPEHNLNNLTYIVSIGGTKK